MDTVIIHPSFDLAQCSGPASPEEKSVRELARKEAGEQRTREEGEGEGRSGEMSC